MQEGMNEEGEMSVCGKAQGNMQEGTRMRTGVAGRIR